MHNQSTNNQSQKPFSCSSMFVGGFDSSTSYFQIKEYFMKYGAVKRVNMVRNSKGGSKGYCFVIFEQSSSVEQALTAKEDAVLNGRKLDCRPILKGKALRDHRKKVNQRRICVRGLPDQMESVEKSYLRRVYQAYGSIENFYFKRDSQGDGRGELQLLITYFEEKSATKCLAAEVVFKQAPLKATALIELDSDLPNQGKKKVKGKAKERKNNNKKNSKELRKGKDFTSKYERKEEARTFQPFQNRAQRSNPYRFKVKKRERDLVNFSWSVKSVSELILMSSHRVDHQADNIRFNRGSQHRQKYQPKGSRIRTRPAARPPVPVKRSGREEEKESSFYSNCTSDNFYPPQQRQSHLPSF